MPLTPVALVVGGLVTARVSIRRRVDRVVEEALRRGPAAGGEGDR